MRSFKNIPADETPLITLCYDFISPGNIARTEREKEERKRQNQKSHVAFSNLRPLGVITERPRFLHHSPIFYIMLLKSYTVKTISIYINVPPIFFSWRLWPCNWQRCEFSPRMKRKAEYNFIRLSGRLNRRRLKVHGTCCERWSGRVVNRGGKSSDVR